MNVPTLCSMANDLVAGGLERSYTIAGARINPDRENAEDDGRVTGDLG